MSPSLIVYAPRVLPLSQTFVADQARALRRWQPTLVGRTRVDGGLDVADLVDRQVEPSGRASTRYQQVTRRVAALQRATQRCHPALIHAHFLTGGIDVFSSLRPPPCPVVVSAHGFDATLHSSPRRTADPRQWLLGALRGRLLTRSVNLIAVSRFIAGELVRLGADEGRITVLPTGVDTAFFQPGPPVSGGGILFVGRLVAQKGVADLLTAAGALKSQGVSAPVRIIGDGPERARLERLARRLRIEVTFLGGQPREAVRDAMQRAEVLCGPSRTDRTGAREGFGMVYAEAQATGLPVVATASGGIPEAVDHGRSGLLVPEGDPRRLAEALRACLTDAALHARLSAASRPRVLERFDLATQTAKLEALYDRWAGSEHNHG